jgi:hypothetical protein
LGKETENKDSNVKTVGSILPGTGLSRRFKTGSFGLRNGYWRDKLIKL